MIALRYVSDSSDVPSIAAGANANNVALDTGSTDFRGSFTFGTPAAPAAGVLVTIVLAQPYQMPSWMPAGQAISVMLLEPGNAATAAAAFGPTCYATPIFSNGQLTGFTISCGLAPAANQGAGTYQLVWHMTP